MTEPLRHVTMSFRHMAKTFSQVAESFRPKAETFPLSTEIFPLPSGNFPRPLPPNDSPANGLYGKNAVMNIKYLAGFAGRCAYPFTRFAFGVTVAG